MPYVLSHPPSRAHARSGIKPASASLLAGSYCRLMSGGGPRLRVLGARLKNQGRGGVESMPYVFLPRFKSRPRGRDPRRAWAPGFRERRLETHLIVSEVLGTAASPAERVAPRTSVCDFEQRFSELCWYVLRTNYDGWRRVDFMYLAKSFKRPKYTSRFAE